MNIFILFIGLISCQKDFAAPPPGSLLYDTIPVINAVNPIIEEASGIADSKLNPGHLWVQEDSGNPPELFLLKHNGVIQRTVFINDATNRDWEDMLLFDGFIYVADIGDNTEVYSNYMIYRFPEPDAAIDTVQAPEKINFSYPDGSHDAEAFLLEPRSKAIYIITKRGARSGIYRLNFPYTQNQVVAKVGELPFNGVTGAALSAGGKTILLRTYFGIFHYNHHAGKSIEQTLLGAYTTLKHILEPQGESITFSLYNGGFYTLSEKGFASSVNLNYYPKK